eukprot:1156531-Pelagomonas_calceolata.AAC.1
MGVITGRNRLSPQGLDLGSTSVSRRGQGGTFKVAIPCRNLYPHVSGDLWSGQRKLSQHQLRKSRHIGSESREPPSPEDDRGVNVDRVGFWKHAAPGHQCYDECFLFSMARLVE